MEEVSTLKSGVEAINQKLEAKENTPLYKNLFRS